MQGNVLPEVEGEAQGVFVIILWTIGRKGPPASGQCVEPGSRHGEYSYRQPQREHGYLFLNAPSRRTARPPEICIRVVLRKVNSTEFSKPNKMFSGVQKHISQKLLRLH